MLKERTDIRLRWSELQVIAAAARRSIRLGADPYQTLYYVINPTDDMVKKAKREVRRQKRLAA